MELISIEEFRDFLSTASFEYLPTQTKLCFPIIQRIHYKMKIGVEFENINVKHDLLINGHHRYVCSLLLKKPIGTHPWLAPSDALFYQWNEMQIDMNDWESPEIIERHNLKDAVKSGLDIDRFKILTGKPVQLSIIYNVIILLDIDGVMIPASGWKAPELMEDGFPNFSIKAVRGLNKILSATNASIILTSTHKSSYASESWKHIFSKRGVNAIISTLKNADKFQSRVEEILDWISSHQNENNFVIIDDDKSLNALPSSLKNKLVLTSPLIGLNEELADQAIQAFGKHKLLKG